MTKACFSLLVCAWASVRTKICVCPLLCAWAGVLLLPCWILDVGVIVGYIIDIKILHLRGVLLHSNPSLLQLGLDVCAPPNFGLFGLFPLSTHVLAPDLSSSFSRAMIDVYTTYLMCLHRRCCLM